MGNKRELLQQLWAMEKEDPTTKISRPDDLLPVLHKYTKRKQEEFVVVTLDGAHQIIRVHSVTKGLVNRTVVHPREVYRMAIKDNAANVILAHNHPSGNCDPSVDDDRVTEQLKSAGEVVGIKVLDHLIISKKGYYSYLEMGKL